MTEILNSYPKIDSNELTPELYEFLDSLPSDYLHFLLENNGGFIPEGSCSFHTNVPYRSPSVEIENKKDSLVELFGVKADDVDLYEGDFPGELIRENLHFVQEEILPSTVLVIGRTAKFGLIAISTDEESDDYGTIYYYDAHWSHPCSKNFFEERINKVIDNYKDISAILENVDHPDHIAVQDEYNYATLVKVADNFADFQSRLFSSEA